MSLKKFYADPHYQIKSFVTTLTIILTACIALYLVHAPGFFTYHFAWWQLFLIPAGIYIGGISAVFIHNATHSSFPNRLLNEICGWMAGIHQLWGYTGWKLIHLVHHQYSDNVEQDPHPTKNRVFSEYLRNMFLRSSRTISKRYREQWGNNASTKRLQGVTVAALIFMAASCVAFWFLLLGPAGFLFFYVPSYITNHLLFAHINYFCHPEDEASGETAASNLNHNLYYKLANFFWCGIYFHGNHHKKPTLFNPRRMPMRQEIREAA